MQYLMIENTGVADVQSFILLGASTSRGTDKIGQFGTGNKHGINVLLRHGLSVVIFCGESKLTFQAHPTIVNGKAFQHVHYRLNDGSPVPTGFTLEFGELDWPNTGMALREFISNALDQSGVKGTTICVESEPSGEPNATRVFIELTKEVSSYFNNLNQRFLQFTDRQHETILRKDAPSKMLMYRRGVQVATSKKVSMFNYNLPDVKVDDSRNLVEWEAEFAAFQAVCSDRDALREVFLTFEGDFDTLEHKFSFTTPQDKANVYSTWVDTFGRGVPVCSKIEAEIVEGKGFPPILVPMNWKQTLINCGVQDSIKLYRAIEAENKILEPSETTIRTRDRVWNRLFELGLTGGKVKPAAFEFVAQMNSGSAKKGYYERDCVYVNTESVGDCQTMLEEIAHHVTGATDNSRDFQDFAFKVATLIAFGGAR